MIKVTDCLWLTAILSVVMTVPAYAYLDAGTASILLQAMIGGVAAGLFVMRGYIYKAKAWFGLAGRRGGTPTDRK
jgi:uncharacterized membrane-anchored protein